MNFWEENLAAALRLMLEGFEARGAVEKEHIQKTPERFIKAYREIFSGVGKSPADVLQTTFSSDADQMILVRHISFVSMCKHHLLPFQGDAHFAYIPDGKIVGLSKIPRLVDMYARRPQVQEAMSDQIVQSFMEIVKPKGCAVMIQAQHMCCTARGIKSSTAVMETTSLRGNFKEAAVKAEFLQAVRGCNGYRS